MLYINNYCDFNHGLSFTTPVYWLFNTFSKSIMEDSIFLHLTAGLLLVVLSYFAFQKIKGPRYCPFAILPLLLSIQQFCAVFIIAVLHHPEISYLATFFTVMLVIVSHVIWPIWFPYAIQQMELTWSIRYLLRFFSFLGVFVALIATWDIVFYDVEVQGKGVNIFLVQSVKGYFQRFGIYFWLITTLLPAFISYTPRVWVLGFVMVITYCFILNQAQHTILFFPPLFAIAIALTMFWILLKVREDQC